MCKIGAQAGISFEISNFTSGLSFHRDDNDNRPVFTPSEYVAAVSENALAGSIVLKVHADDYDSGLNSLVLYSLANDTQFSIDEKTGVIRTTRNQTHCPRVKCDQSDCSRTCVLTVTAQDHGGLTGRARIFASLLDENDHAPEITFRYYPSASPYATVAEDAPNGTIVAVVNVKDLDDGLNGKVTNKRISSSVILKNMHGGNRFSRGPAYTQP